MAIWQIPFRLLIMHGATLSHESQFLLPELNSHFSMLIHSIDTFHLNLLFWSTSLLFCHLAYFYFHPHVCSLPPSPSSLLSSISNPSNFSADHHNSSLVKHTRGATCKEGKETIGDTRLVAQREIDQWRTITDTPSTILILVDLVVNQDLVSLAPLEPPLLPILHPFLVIRGTPVMIHDFVSRLRG